VAFSSRRLPLEINQMKLILLCIAFFSPTAFAESHSVARLWNEAALGAIRLDYARPTVAARNLYHLSVIFYDTWAVYEPGAKRFFINFEVKSENVEKDRGTALSYAAYRLLMRRFASAPKAEQIGKDLNSLMQSLGHDPAFEGMDLNTAAGVGNMIAQMVLDQYSFDGSLEANDYATPPGEYGPLNPPMIVKLPGVGALIDVNLWQPMALDSNVDQGGNPVPAKVVRPLTLHWGRLPPFALTPADASRERANVYFDPGLPPQFGGEGHELFRKSMEQVVEYSSWLDPRDRVEIDISPASIGNNSLGKNDGRGHSLNPFTKAPYATQKVWRGDFARVLAEFWADGPNSETPPGHWNTVANYVSDRPEFRRRWMGMGPELSPLEWDVKLYLALNGALYDASIAAWGIKGYYQGSRPISAIRYLAGLGQASDPRSPSYHSLGLHLKPGLIELITTELTEPGERFAHLVGHEGKIAVRSWLGAPKNSKDEFKGVGWILGSEWLPYQRPTFVTPPFPGYVSGHSTFSRAAAEVMTAATGSKFFPGGLAEFSAERNEFLVFEDGPERSLKLQWATYFDAADQCSVSRIYGGIHGSMDDFPGREIGSRIGRKSLAKVRDLFAR
jgi:hypothetical protein